MPSTQKSILKKPKTALPSSESSIRHSGSVSSGKRSSGSHSQKDLERNTKLNSGSKFSKSIAISRGGGKMQNRAGRYTKSGPEDADDDDEEEEEESDGFGGDEEGGDVEMGASEDDGMDTDEEIARGKSEKEKKPLKRKRPATTAETFGSTLTSLLSEPTKKPKTKKSLSATSTPSEVTEPAPKLSNKVTTTTTKPGEAILSLSAARAPPSRSAENLERKAKRHLQALKEEKEDKARIRNVVEGWAARSGDDGVVFGGQEFEKGLRKTAQRGVIKLFNAILVASKNAEEATTSLSAKAGVKEEKAKGKKDKDNILGRGGKEAGLTQESFLDLVRRG